jgi:hypothetical protein
VIHAVINQIGTMERGWRVFSFQGIHQGTKKIDTRAALLDAAAPPQLLDGDNVTTVKIPGLWPLGPTPKEQRHTHTRVCVYNVSEREQCLLLLGILLCVYRRIRVTWSITPLGEEKRDAVMSARWTLYTEETNRQIVPRRALTKHINEAKLSPR